MPIRLGLAGCGRLAERGWLPAIARVPEVRLAAVADRERARCRALAPTVPAFDDAAQLVRGVELDAVIVATPAATHGDDAEAAAAAGLPALVEKPPSSQLGDAHRLASLAPPPWIGFNRRFDPRFRRLRAATPTSGSLALALRFDYRRTSWAPHVADDDALLDVGSHLLDLARWLTGGEIRRVRAAVISQAHASLELDLTRGRAAVGCSTTARYRELAEVRNAKGTPVGHAGRGGRLDALRRRLGREPQPLVVSLAAELEAFCAAVRGERAPDLAAAADGVAAMAAVEAARRSAAEHGAWVEVGVEPEPAPAQG
jgi:predicted dehydrogenase